MTDPLEKAAIILFAVLSLGLLYSLDDYYPNQQRIKHSIPSLLPPSHRLNNSKWSWADRVPHFPVQSLTTLPDPPSPPTPLPRIQHSFPPELPADRTTRLRRRASVRATFLKSWSSYHTRAYLADELTPLTGRSTNPFGGWAATLLDSLDTLYLMALDDEFDAAVTASLSIDFTSSRDRWINTFETNIRHLGGLLAAFDLSRDVRLLDKARQVGEMLLVPFDTPTHLPITRWDWRQARSGVNASNSSSSRQETPSFHLLSELGTFTLEFTRLSQLTGDMRWYDAASRITHFLVEQQQRPNNPLPGLWPTVIYPQSNNNTNTTAAAYSTFTLGSMSDSAYEYLLKTYILLNGAAPIYQSLYENATAAALKHLLFQPMTPDNLDILVSGDVVYNPTSGSVAFDPKMQHLSCFLGGMLALGARVCARPSHLDVARKLTEGCTWAYDSMIFGVMPEVARLVPCPTLSPCEWNETYYHEVLEGVYKTSNGTARNASYIAHSLRLPPGYTAINDRRYILRPEAIESLFYLYRITGDRRIPDIAWTMFNSIDDLTSTEFGNAAIVDLTVVDRRTGMPPKEDRMESFWMAETLKYFYLIFSEPDLISLDQWVFNTEAHPFRRPV